jgi:hypothetical protein
MKNPQVKTFFDVGTMERPARDVRVRHDLDRAIVLAVDNARSLGLRDKGARDEFVRRLVRRRRRRGAVDPLERLADALCDAFGATAATDHAQMPGMRKSLARLLSQTIDIINESKDT